MKVATTLFVLSASSLAAACGSGPYAHQEYIRKRDLALGKRQGPATSSAAVSTPIASGVASTPVSTSVGATSVPGATVTSAAVVLPTTPTIPGTHIPALSELTMGGPIESELPMFTTYTAGATPPVSGVVPLPSIAIVGTAYPPLDRTPAIDSTEVRAWLAELDLSKVPTFGKTVDGSCLGDPAAAADTSRCWWTCGGCIRPTDISTCPTKMDWGISYDDGPSPYTPKLLNYLHEKNLRATFYVVGSRVISRPAMLQTEYMSGHEISIHTWSHTPLTTLTNEQIVAELAWTRKAIKDVIGVSPNTFRPPYGDIDDRVRAVAAAMGLTPVLWTSAGGVEFDTKDWRIAGGTANGTSSFAAWQAIVGKATSIDTGFVTLQHDLYQESTDMAVGYILPDALAHQPPFNIEPIIECQGKTLENAYAESDGVADQGAAGSPGGVTASVGGSAAASRAATATRSGAAATGSNSAVSGAPLNSLVVVVAGIVGATVAMGASLVL